jgi:hypothetical protein
MQTPRAEIARERRGQMQVRRAFETGLGDGPAWSDRQPREYCLACADCLLFSMERLHSQDQLIHDLLRERIAPSEADWLLVAGVTAASVARVGAAAPPGADPESFTAEHPPD